MTVKAKVAARNSENQKSERIMAMGLSVRISQVLGHGNGLFPRATPAGENALAPRAARCAHGAMTDHFATLGQPRRPWLEPEALKHAFHQLSAALHPDVPGTGDGERFAALNAAYSVLREPSARVRHLLEISAPAAVGAPARPPAEITDLFMEIAGLRRRLDEFLAKRNRANSVLARALLAGDESALRRELLDAQNRLETAEATALDELREADLAWQTGSLELAPSLNLLAQRLAYLARWITQLREALFSLGS
jgi:hypothetical protein